VSDSSLSRGARRGAVSSLPSRRLRRFALHCESLELRQLLSVGQGSYAAGVVSGQIVAQPALAVSPLVRGGGPTGLSPSQLRTAYGVNQISFGSVSGTGAGQTIAIIDSYFDPNISSDLARFDSQYGLSAPPSLTQYVENGLWWNNSGWALETALDVEWAHAIAPAANIVLVEAQPDLNDLFSAVGFASGLSGVSVVSMSWGAGEFAGETAYDSVFTTPAGHNGVTFVAASGDSGTTEYPSASPNVLSVGGTTLNVSSQGAYLSEKGWSGSGTGSSPYESEPSWQSTATSASGRTTPDVAWDANPSTGVSVYDSVPYYGQSGWFTVGGTSVGAPSWAGLIAIADQGLAQNHIGSLSNAQTSLYQSSSSNFNQLSAKTYGLVTGLGSPKANLLVPALVQLNTPASPGGTSSAVVAAKSSAPVVGRNDLLPPTVTNPTTAGTGSSSSSSSSSTSSISITALNPSSTSSTTTPTVAPVYIVPPPLPPLVIHLGASVSPVTTQAVLSPLAVQEEQPASITRFGQSSETELDKLFKPQVGPRQDAPPLIDDVEPFQPLGPADAPKGERDLGPGPRGDWPSRVLTEPGSGAVLELAGRSTPAEDRGNGTPPAGGFSTLFGAAMVAAGGYHLALRWSDRFRGRSASRWAGVNPSGRRFL